jgi:hypothetical protein
VRTRIAGFAACGVSQRKRLQPLAGGYFETHTGLVMTNRKTRAERAAKKHQQALDGAAAMAEYEAVKRAEKEKTARLRALRLNRPAPECVEEEAAGEPTGPGRSVATLMAVSGGWSAYCRVVAVSRMLGSASPIFRRSARGTLCLRTPCTRSPQLARCHDRDRTGWEPFHSLAAWPRGGPLGP